MTWHDIRYVDQHHVTTCHYMVVLVLSLSFSAVLVMTCCFRMWSEQTEQQTLLNHAEVKKGKEAYSSLCYKHRTATGTHVPYGITQCYLPPGRGDIPALPQPIKASTRFSDPRGMQGWVDLVGLVTFQGGIPARRWSPITGVSCNFSVWCVQPGRLRSAAGERGQHGLLPVDESHHLRQDGQRRSGHVCLRHSARRGRQRHTSARCHTWCLGDTFDPQLLGTCETYFIFEENACSTPKRLYFLNDVF